MHLSIPTQRLWALPQVSAPPARTLVWPLNLPIENCSGLSSDISVDSIRIRIHAQQSYTVLNDLLALFPSLFLFSSYDWWIVPTRHKFKFALRQPPGSPMYTNFFLVIVNRNSVWFNLTPPLNFYFFAFSNLKSTMKSLIFFHLRYPASNHHKNRTTQIVIWELPPPFRLFSPHMIHFSCFMKTKRNFLTWTCPLMQNLQLHPKSRPDWTTSESNSMFEFHYRRCQWVYFFILG